MTAEEHRLLYKLEKLFARQEFHKARGRLTEVEIAIATKRLAKMRGVIFLRPERIKQEIAEAYRETPSE